MKSKIQKPQTAANDETQNTTRYTLLNMREENISKEDLMKIISEEIPEGIIKIFCISGFLSVSVADYTYACAPPHVPKSSNPFQDNYTL